MQYITFVFLAITLALVHTEDKCFSLNTYKVKGCCKNFKKPDENMKNLWQKCAKESSSDKPCEIETCVAKENGILADDGTIDKDKIIAEINKHLDSKELSDTIKEKCLDQDLAGYGSADMCLIKKMFHCAALNMLVACELSDAESCNEFKSTLEECKKVIS